MIRGPGVHNEDATRVYLSMLSLHVTLKDSEDNELACKSQLSERHKSNSASSQRHQQVKMFSVLADTQP